MAAEQLPAQDLARHAANLALDRKGEEIDILDLRSFNIGCEYFVIVSATTEPHVRAIAEWIEDEMHSRHGARPWHREGVSQARWILLDYVDLVVHIFQKEAREFYRLERLWGDAPRETQGPDVEHEEGSE